MSAKSRSTALRFRPYERALFARQVVVTMLPVVVYLLPLETPPGPSILYLAGAATVLNFLYYLLHINGRFPPLLRWGRLALDMCFWTAFLSLTGGPGSLFFLGYLAEILISAIAVSSAGCLGAGILASSGFLLLLLVQPGMLSWEEAAARLLALLLTGSLSFVLIRRLETRSRRVESLNEQISIRAERIRRESEELERKLARAETLSRLGAAASGVAHELRNTIHGLSGFLSILRRDLGGEPRYSRLVKLIESGVEGMNDISEGLLTLARDEPLAITTVDLRELIGEAIAFSTGGRQANGVAITFRETDPPHLIQANRGALRGLFVNLINNALEAMPDGGRLTIQAALQSPDRLRIAFTDTGSGIAPAIRERIFEPFVTTRDQGAGLGLAISRQTVARCGGQLILCRTGSEGTTMTVLLPVAGPSHTLSLAKTEPLPQAARTR